MSETDAETAGARIAELAAALRTRQALRRSDSLNRLFDYLAQCAQAGLRPKEFEVAASVFGRSSAFDGARDASVRVAVHRLRRRYAELLQAEVADTLDDGGDVEGELRALLAALATV